jgi:hypothetical protein
MKYYDKEGKQIPIHSWINLMENRSYKFVGKEIVNHREFKDLDPITVSTVWLGLDHSFYGSLYGAPILIFETMIFGHEEFDGYQERYSTLEEAKEGHKRAVEFVKNKLKDL